MWFTLAFILIYFDFSMSSCLVNSQYTNPADLGNTLLEVMYFIFIPGGLLLWPAVVLAIVALSKEKE